MVNNTVNPMTPNNWITTCGAEWIIGGYEEFGEKMIIEYDMYGLPLF